MSLTSFLTITFHFSCVCIVAVSASKDDDLIVTLKEGKSLKGIRQESNYTKTAYIEFRGIPYANPPKGDLRFKSPVKYDGVWSESGSRDATSYGSVCPQLNALDMDSDEPTIGDEDCLFLNVNTPKVNPKKKYPVAVWIHGGSFQFESGDAYGPQKFMEHPIVLVTFNYRLSVFGFLNSEDGLIQGNMGLKDQVLVLQWVQENIEKFGGDPKQVTIFGANSGAVSVHLHLLSDMSKGLFHRAISQSGSALAPWAITRNPSRRIDKMAKLLKCENSTDSVYDCLMKGDASQMIVNTQGYSEWFIDPLVPTGPTIELSGNEPKFLSRNPYAIIKSGEFHGKNIPWIIGVNSHEGLLHSADIVNHGVLKRVFNWEWHKAAPITLMYQTTAIDHLGVSNNVWKFYFEKEEDKKSGGSDDSDGETTLEEEKSDGESENPDALDTKEGAEDTKTKEEEAEDTKTKEEATEDAKPKEEATENEKTKEEAAEVDGDSKDEIEKLIGEENLKVPDSFEIPKLEKPKPGAGFPGKGSDLFVDKDNRMAEITNMYSDRYFFHPLHHTGRMHIIFGGKSPAPVYVYYFEYSGKQSIIQWSGHTDRDYGVSHFDQIQYMFNTPYFNETEGADTEFGKEYVKGIVQFITNGKPPSPKWQPISTEMAKGETPLVYNKIGSSNEDIVMEEPFTERITFWNNQLILELEKENLVDSLTDDDSQATETLSDVKKDEL